MIRRRSALRAALLTLLGPLAARSAWADEERVVAIVSLVADHLTVTGFETTTGSLLAQNQTERIPLQTDELERAVLRAALRAVQESRRGRPVPLLINDGRLYRDQDSLVAGGRVVLPDSLRQTLQSQRATHLLLATKHRDDARMRAQDVTLGTGKVEGLGFYVDRVTTLRREGTSAVATGYLAPHYYARYSLIDLRDKRLLDSRTVTASAVYTAAGTAAGADPWELLDSAGKMKALSDLIADASAPVLRQLVAS